VALDEHVVHVDGVERPILRLGRRSKVDRPPARPKPRYFIQHMFMDTLDDVERPLPSHGDHVHQWVEPRALGQVLAVELRDADLLGRDRV